MREARLSSFGGLELNSRHQMMIGSNVDASRGQKTLKHLRVASPFWEKIPQIHTLSWERGLEAAVTARAPARRESLFNREKGRRTLLKIRHIQSLLEPAERVRTIKAELYFEKC